MKPLKFICFFLAGAIIQLALFILYVCLGLLGGGGGLVAISMFTAVLGVCLGFAARKLAVKKMKMSANVLTMSYVAGTLAFMAVIFIYALEHDKGLFAISLAFSTLPSAAVNAVIQLIICIIDKINQNKEKNNGTL